MEVSAIVPIIQKVMMFSDQHPNVMVTIVYELLMGFFYVIGVVIYVVRILERWMPRMSDLAIVMASKALVPKSFDSPAKHVRGSMSCESASFKDSILTNRGTKQWPGGQRGKRKRRMNSRLVGYVKPESVQGGNNVSGGMKELVML